MQLMREVSMSRKTPPAFSMINSERAPRVRRGTEEVSCAGRQVGAVHQVGARLWRLFAGLLTAPPRMFNLL